MDCVIRSGKVNRSYNKHLVLGGVLVRDIRPQTYSNNNIFPKMRSIHSLHAKGVCTLIDSLKTIIDYN